VKSRRAPIKDTNGSRLSTAKLPELSKKRIAKKANKLYFTRPWLSATNGGSDSTLVYVLAIVAVAVTLIVVFFIAKKKKQN